MIAGIVAFFSKKAIENARLRHLEVSEAIKINGKTIIEALDGNP